MMRNQTRAPLAAVVAGSSKTGAEPFDIVAGDSVSFEVRAPAHMAADGWSLIIYLINETDKLSLPSVGGGGGDYLIELSNSATASWAAGDYKFNGFLIRGAERLLAMWGSAIIRPDFSALASLDARSHVEKILDALNSMLEGKASLDQQSYSIGDRTLSRLSPEEILKWRNEYRRLFFDEQRAESTTKGGGRTIQAVFT